MTRGKVIEVDRPLSDRTGSKVRPAVAVQADSLNSLIDDTILVQIPSSRFGIPGTEVLDPAIETGVGLTEVCVATCINLLTVDRTQIVRTVGYLSDAALRQIETCLKSTLELP